MKLVEMKVNEFVDLMASDEPAPGGGSAAALEGALGAALTAMVCALTVGKKKYADVQELAIESQKKGNELKAQFVDVIDRDTEAFNAVSAVFAMPKDTDEEKAARKAAMQEALKGCTKTPFEMMELACQALELTRSVVGKLNASAASDLGCAALSLKAAIQGAWLNVLINIGGIQDQAFADEYRQKGQALLDKALPLADAIYQEVLESLRSPSQESPTGRPRGVNRRGGVLVQKGVPMAPHITHLTQADYQISQWSGGTTTQIAIAPQGALYADRDFLWRLSSATVDLDESDFTPLPDYHRLIAPLRGEMELTHDGGPLISLAPYQVHAFDGGADTHSRGRCVDFNLMLRKDRCAGSVSPLRTSGGPVSFSAEPGSSTLILYCAEGSGTLTFAGESSTIASGEAVLIQDPGSAPLHLDCPGPASFMAAQVRSLP